LILKKSMPWLLKFYYFNSMSWLFTLYNFNTFLDRVADNTKFWPNQCFTGFLKLNILTLQNHSIAINKYCYTLNSTQK
jgi:hypothetical protein